jgi:hypothetical protein
MKLDESFPEIGALLRTRQPQVAPPKGMEARILRALAAGPRRSAAPRWPWLALPPAFAAAALGIFWHPTSGEIVTSAAPANGTVAGASPLQSVLGPSWSQPMSSLPKFTTPLESESLALAHDARRAGDFLIGCLPSLNLDP